MTRTKITEIVSYLSRSFIHVSFLVSLLQIVNRLYAYHELYHPYREIEGRVSLEKPMLLNSKSVNTL